MADTPAFDKATLAWTLPWDADWVTAVAIAGRRLFAGNNQGHVLAWDLPEKPDAPAPAPVRRLDGHTNVVTRLLVTPDARWLLSASYDHTIRYWDVQGVTAGTDVVVLNARRRQESSRRGGGKVPPPEEAKVAIQPAARVLEGHKDWVLGLSLSADGKLLASGDDGREVVLWDRISGKEVRRWKLDSWAYALALSPDGKRLLAGERVPLVFDSGRQAGIKLWDTATGTVVHDLAKVLPKDQHFGSAAFSADGKVLAVGRGGEVGGSPGKITFIDPSTGKKTVELTPGHLDGLTDLVFHPDGKHLASSGRDTVVRIWSTPEGKLVKELGNPRGGQFKDWVHAVAFSADGHWLAAADMAGQVQVWHLP
jgi:WD40 repeat protein